MRKLSLLSLAILLAACTFTVTPDLQQRGVFISWPRVVATVTPTQTQAPITQTQVPITHTPIPIPTFDPTPTQESTQVADSTPVVFPTNEPLPALLPVVDVLNVRSGAGTNRSIIGSIGRTDCVAFDPRVTVQANGYTWVQVHIARFGEGTWVAAKVIGGSNLVRFYSGQPCVFQVNYPLP